MRGHHLKPYNVEKLPEIVRNNEFFLPILEGNHQPLIWSFPQMNGITMAANKKPRLWIVEDFYDDPDSVREFALNQQYFDDPGFIGKRTRQQFFFPGMKEKFEQAMGMRITNWESHGMNGHFQHNVAGEAITWHTDFQKFAGLIYLTPNAPYSAGTRMAAYKKNRVRHCSDPHSDREQRTATAQAEHRRRQSAVTEDDRIREWLEEVYLPIDRAVASVLKTYKAEINALAADPFDDQLLEDFGTYLEQCIQRQTEAEKLFQSCVNPAKLAQFAATLYYCLSHIGDGLKELGYFTTSYDETYLHTGREMFRLATQLRQEIHLAHSRL